MTYIIDVNLESQCNSEVHGKSNRAVGEVIWSLDNIFTETCGSFGLPPLTFVAPPYITTTVKFLSLSVFNRFENG